MVSLWKTDKGFQDLGIIGDHQYSEKLNQAKQGGCWEHIRTNAHDVFVSEVIAVVEEPVGGERHYHDAKAEIRHA